jgi:hypothetical protein
MLFWVLSSSVSMLVLVVIVRWYLGMERARAIRVAESTDRGLFRFSDGVKVRSIDPISVLMDMEAHDRYRFDIHPQRVAEGDKESQEITVDAVRGAFRVGEFTAVGRPGLTFQECLKLWDSFCWFIDQQKKNSERPPTWQPSMEQTSSESDPPITNDTLDSGSTDDEPSLSQPRQ